MQPVQYLETFKIACKFRTFIILICVRIDIEKSENSLIKVFFYRLNVTLKNQLLFIVKVQFRGDN